MDAASLSCIQCRVSDLGEGAAPFLGEVGPRPAITDQKPAVVLEACARIDPLQPGAKGAHWDPWQGRGVIGRSGGLTKLVAYG
jgi:hypothetical protein